MNRNMSESYLKNLANELYQTELDFAKTSGEIKMIEVSEPSNKEKKIFRGNSNESLHRNASDMLAMHNEEYLINIDNMALGDILGKKNPSFVEGNGSCSSNGRNSNHPLSDGYPEDQNQYYSYGDKGTGLVNPKMPSPEFSKKVLQISSFKPPNTSSLNFDKGQVLFRDSEDSLQPSKIIEDQKMKSKFSMSNKEFLKAREQSSNRISHKDFNLNLQESITEEATTEFFRTKEKEGLDEAPVKDHIIKNIDLNMYELSRTASLVSDTREILTPISTENKLTDLNEEKRENDESNDANIKDMIDDYLKTIEQIGLEELTDDSVSSKEEPEVNEEVSSVNDETEINNDNTPFEFASPDIAIELIGDSISPDNNDIELNFTEKNIKRKTLTNNELDLEINQSDHSGINEIDLSDYDLNQEDDQGEEIRIEGIDETFDHQSKAKTLGEQLNGNYKFKMDIDSYQNDICTIKEVENSVFTKEYHSETTRIRKESIPLKIKEGENPKLRDSDSVYQEKIASNSHESVNREDIDSNNDNASEGNHDSVVNLFKENLDVSMDQLIANEAASESLSEKAASNKERSINDQAIVNYEIKKYTHIKGETVENSKSGDNSFNEKSKDTNQVQEQEQEINEGKVKSQVNSLENSDITIQHNFSSYKTSKMNSMIANDIENIIKKNKNTISETNESSSSVINFSTVDDDSKFDSPEEGNSMVEEVDVEMLVIEYLDQIREEALAEWEESSQGSIVSRGVSESQYETYKLSDEDIENSENRSRVSGTYNEGLLSDQSLRSDEIKQNINSSERRNISEQVMNLFEDVDSEDADLMAKTKNIPHSNFNSTFNKKRNNEDQKFDVIDQSELLKESDSQTYRLNESVMSRKNNDKMSDFSVWERLKERESTKFIYQNDFITLAMQNDNMLDSESEGRSQSETETETETESEWEMDHSMREEQIVQTEEDEESEGNRDYGSFEVLSEQLIRKDQFSVKEMDMVDIIRMKMKSGEITPDLQKSKMRERDEKEEIGLFKTYDEDKNRDEDKDIAKKSNELETFEDLKGFNIESIRKSETEDEPTRLGKNLEDSMAVEIDMKKKTIVTKSVEINNNNVIVLENEQVRGSEGSTSNMRNVKQKKTQQNTDIMDIKTIPIPNSNETFNKKNHLSIDENSLAGLISVSGSLEPLGKLIRLDSNEVEIKIKVNSKQDLLDKADKLFSKKKHPKQVLVSENFILEEKSKDYSKVPETEDDESEIQNKKSIWNGEFSEIGTNYESDDMRNENDDKAKESQVIYKTEPDIEQDKKAENEDSYISKQTELLIDSIEGKLERIAIETTNKIEDAAILENIDNDSGKEKEKEKSVENLEAEIETEPIDNENKLIEIKSMETEEILLKESKKPGNEKIMNTDLKNDSNNYLIHGEVVSERSEESNEESTNQQSSLDENNISVRTQEKYPQNFNKQTTKKRQSNDLSFDVKCQIESKKTFLDSDKALRRTMKAPNVKQTKTVSEIYPNMLEKKNSDIEMNSSINLKKQENQTEDSNVPAPISVKSKELDFSVLRGSLLHSKSKDTKQSNFKFMNKNVKTERNSLVNNSEPVKTPKQLISVKYTKKTFFGNHTNKNAIHNDSKRSQVSNRSRSITGKSVVTFVNAFDTDNLTESFPINQESTKIFSINNQSMQAYNVKAFKTRTAGNSYRKLNKVFRTQVQKPSKITSSVYKNHIRIIKPKTSSQVQMKTYAKPNMMTAYNEPRQVKYVYRNPSPISVVHQQRNTYHEVERQTQNLDKRLYRKKPKKKINFISKNIQRVRELSESRRKIKAEEIKSMTSKSFKKQSSVIDLNTSESELGSYKEIYTKKLSFYVDSIKNQRMQPRKSASKTVKPTDTKKSFIKKYSKIKFGQRPNRIYKSEIDRISDNIKRSMSPKLRNSKPGYSPARSNYGKS